MIFMDLLIVAAGGLFVLPTSRAVSWQLLPTTPPWQCATATVIITSNDTAPPLRLLLIPYGPLPLSGASKTIYDIPSSNLDRMDFQVKYPAGTQFVELVNAIHDP